MEGPDLEPGPLRDLIDALFDLRERAGEPGLTKIKERLTLRGQHLGRSTIHRVFVGGTRPKRPDLLAVVAELARGAREDVAEAQRRFEELWELARDTSTSSSDSAPPQAGRLQRVTEETRLQAEIDDLRTEIRTARLHLAGYLIEPIHDIGAQRVAYRSAQLVPKSQPSDSRQGYVLLTKNRLEELAKGNGPFPSDEEINSLADTLGLTAEVKQGMRELSKFGSVASESRRQKQEQLQKKRSKRRGGG